MIRKTINNMVCGFCWIAACITASMLPGCGNGQPPSKIIEGVVRCDGENVMQGQIHFVPINQTDCTPCVTDIHDGQYRIDAHGGVPVGRYRVEIVAEKRTGRKVPGYTGFEQSMVDETVRVGPPTYAGAESPLSVEVTRTGDGRFDFNLPKQ